MRRKGGAARGFVIRFGAIQNGSGEWISGAVFVLASERSGCIFGCEFYKHRKMLEKYSHIRIFLGSWGNYRTRKATLKTTRYFDIIAAEKHPEAVRYRDYVERALTEYVAFQEQSDGRTRRWVFVPQEGKYLRVIIEPDGETVHNAFFDRGFRR